MQFLPVENWLSPTLLTWPVLYAIGKSLQLLKMTDSLSRFDMLNEFTMNAINKIDCRLAIGQSHVRKQKT